MWRRRWLQVSVHARLHWTKLYRGMFQYSDIIDFNGQLYTRIIFSSYLDGELFE